NDEGIDKEEGNMPEVFLMKMADSALEMRLTAKTADYRLAFEVSCRLRENIYKKFNEEGIDFPFPHRDLRIIKTKTEKLAD
ncbi:MAG: hypothetical protein HYV28_15770, partial [Ignavibacteriales bacterium]|nr:hypothetical protein [Ignavibacteriales bacterium]